MVSDAEVRLDIMEWAAQVTTMLNDHNNSLQNKVTLPRVAMDLMNVKPEAYVPRYISLGPYHHRKLIKDIASSAPATSERHSLKMSTAEEYKVKSAATVSQKLISQHGKSFNSIVEAIEGKRLEFERFYDWKIEDDQSFKNFSLMMAVDSTFLLYFLFGLLRDQTQPDAATSIASFSSHDDTYYLSLLEGCIKCDILKLENQIPLVVLQHVFNEERDVLPGARYRDFYDLLRKTYMAFSPFYAVDKDRFESNLISNDAVATQPHLLGCMHAFVSPFLGMQAGLVENDTERTLFQKVEQFLADIVPTVLGFLVPLKPHFNGYSVKGLYLAGINFESFSDPQQHIRLDKYSKTLYLPLITISSIYTEVFLRNMLALEFNDPGLCNSVTGFVKLMHCLINTPEDVKMLRNFGIIRSTRLTDEDVAKMWDGMCQPFFTGHLEPPQVFKPGLHEVLTQNYYKMKLRMLPVTFRGFGPFLGLSVGLFGLYFTLMQTICNFIECKTTSDDWQTLFISPSAH